MSCNSILFLVIVFLGLSAQQTITGFYFKDFETHDNYIYGVDFNAKRFQILNVMTPDAPHLYSSLYLNYSPFRISVSGNYAYILQTAYSEQQNNIIDATYTYGYLSIIDISYPSLPILRYTGSSIYNAHSLSVVGSLLFLSADQLYVYNISVPNLPVLKLTISMYNPGEITAKMVDKDNYIILAADKYNLYSYKVYRSGFYLYSTLSSYLNINVRDVFLSGNYVFAVSFYNIYEYSIDNNGSLYSMYTRNSALNNKANMIIYDNTTNYQYINYQPYYSGIAQFNIASNDICTYDTGYQTDVIAKSSHYFYATQTNGGHFIVINENNEACAQSSPTVVAMGVIIGIVGGIVFFICVLCFACFSFRHYRRVNITAYKPITGSPVIPSYPQPQIYPTSAGIQTYGTQPYPQVYPQNPYQSNPQNPYQSNPQVYPQIYSQNPYQANPPPPY